MIVFKNSEENPAASAGFSFKLKKPMATFEMTGFVQLESKHKNIKYKADFVEHIKQFGWEHQPLTHQTDYLIYSRTGTSKWNRAQSIGVKCMTYIEVLEMLEGIELWKMI